jgi:hypothetical protein
MESPCRSSSAGMLTRLGRALGRLRTGHATAAVLASAYAAPSQVRVAAGACRRCGRRPTRRRWPFAVARSGEASSPPADSDTEWLEHHFVFMARASLPGAAGCPRSFHG